MLTAQKAREIVNHSKIYEKISEAASKGEFETILDYMTNDIFESLKSNNFKIYIPIDNDEIELSKYDEVLCNEFKSFVIDWM